MHKPTLNFVSGMATPPVNPLLRALANRDDVQLRIWYAEEIDPKVYNWKTNPTHEIHPAVIYGKQWPNQRLLKVAQHCTSDQAFIIAGWTNASLRVLIPLLASRGRRFAFFTDKPSDKERTLSREILREIYLGILRKSSTLFTVGKTALDYFAQRRFHPNQLCNLPLPVELPSNLRAQIPSKESIRDRFKLSPQQIFLVTGSRLVREKGFDLMLSAVSRLGAQDREKLKILIVGSGPDKAAIERQISTANMTHQVQLEPWMEFADFCGCIGAADIVVHPARMDAYGGITLTAVGLGVPVIGTRQAGSAVELIHDGENGFLYEAEDVSALTKHLVEMIRDEKLREAMARASHALSANWTAEHLADTLVQRLFKDGILHG